MALNNKEKRKKACETREKIKKLLPKGFTSRELAQKIGVAVSTVEFHISAMMQETNSANRVQLAVKIATGG